MAQPPNPSLLWGREAGHQPRGHGQGMGDKAKTHGRTTERGNTLGKLKKARLSHFHLSLDSVRGGFSTVQILTPIQMNPPPGAEEKTK